MIVSRTPLRISFCGGGSDLASFYEFSPIGGAVVSTTINKYIYITVNKKFDDLIRASYSITELVKDRSKLKHELIREALGILGLEKGIEITSISDIPGEGAGLGSSSSCTVGLLNALCAYKNSHISKKDLAENACYVEIDLCKKPIGKQDQYAAAYGGLNYIQFYPNHNISVDPITCKKETKIKLQENLLLLYTGIIRSSSSILKRQNQEVRTDSNKQKILCEMVELAKRLKTALMFNRLDDFGDLLHQNWELKKQLTKGISNNEIDEWYKVARAYGATGGKILGAGGGGFLLLYAPKEKHENICAALPKLRPISFSFETEGSKIIYYED